SSKAQHEIENDMVLQAAHNSLSHRSIDSLRSVRSSASLNKLRGSKGYRDELERVAEHLEDHIAFLNLESDTRSPRSSRGGSLRTHQVGLGITVGKKNMNRARADSDATCVTLCSDAGTALAHDASE